MRFNFSDKYRGSACVLSKVTGVASEVATLRRDINVHTVIIIIYSCDHQ